MRRILIALALVSVSAACVGEEGFWTEDIPRPEDEEEDEPCSESAPNGVCDDGQTCRAGQCLDDNLFCSEANKTGVCPTDDETCVDGTCVANGDLCSDANPTGACADGLTCTNGVCATDEPCAPDEPQGFCDTGLACLDGACVDRTLLCSIDNDTGLCRDGFACVEGQCADEDDVCAPTQPNGLCAFGKQCVGGVCHTPEELCSDDNTSGACDIGLSCVDGECTDASQVCGCADGQTCVDGVCRDPEQLCSAQNPNGVCEGGDSCVAGSCVDLGAACSPSNLTGVCAPGELCDDGECVVVDGTALCDDDNECTTDTFDPIRNRCRNDSRSGSCDDGNACTDDACNSDGVCAGTAIGGCIEPPVLDPIPSPTNVGALTIRGTKPAGSSVEINGLIAVSENPDATWNVNVNLVPGDNAFVVRSVDQGAPSATREVHVIYDITSPTTRVTPEGGAFLTGVTATLASDEPATVFFTTDGSEPTETSSSFTSLKQLRIFADTHLRLRARDLAGNLETEIVDVTFNVSARGSAWGEGPDLAEPLSLAGAASNATNVFVVGGTDGLAPQAGAYAYAIADETWTTLPSLPGGARDSLAVVTVSGEIYAIGGQNAGTPLNRVERLPAGGAAWEARAPMPSTRHSLAAVQLNDSIFVFGGKSNGDSVLTNVEVYSISGNSWSNAVAQMPRARAGHGAVLVDNLIYVVGGEGDDGEPVAEVDVYDPSGNVWTTRTSIPTPRSYPGVTVVENQGAITTGPKGIVVAGGRVVGGVASAVVEEYVIADDAWYPRSPLPAPRHSAAATTVVVASDVDSTEGEGWLLGGQEGSNIVSSTRTLRSTRDYVQRLPDLPEARFLAAATALDDRIYVLGGRNFTEADIGWAFDPETGAYEELPQLDSFQNGPGAIAVGDRVYLIGGADGFGNSVPTTRAYDPALREWVDLRPMTSARRDVAIAAIGNNIFVIGGHNGGALQTVEIYDTVDDRWTTGPLLPSPRTGAMAVAHGGAIHVVGGEDTGGAAVTSVLRLDGSDASGAGGTWTTLGGSIAISYGNAFPVQGRIAVFAGRTGIIANNVVEYDVGSQTVVVPRLPGSSLSPALDRRAATLHNGRIYFFGGNESAALGPSGVARVEELEARCFDGVQDARESGVDEGGGCPAGSFLHHTGTGITFFNDRPNNIQSAQGALDACNAHHGGNVCEVVDCGGCEDVTRPLSSGQSCTCSVTSPGWAFGNNTCLSGSLPDPAAGKTFQAQNCGTTVLGFWD